MGKCDYRIVVLQRGFVVVGNFEREGEMCRLTKAACVRRWGTSKGLGELAAQGPLKNTVLDKQADTEFHVLTVIQTIACDPEKWAKVLA